MKTNARTALLVAMVLTSVPLLACDRDRGEASGDTTPAGETASQPVRVTQVDLGSAISADKRVSALTTEFRPNDTIYASVVTEGSAASATLMARWTFENGQVVDESTQTLSPSGPAVTEFHVSKADGWPLGKYRVEILLNGASTQTREFEVK